MSSGKSRQDSRSSGSTFLAPFQVPLLTDLQTQASRAATANAAPAGAAASGLVFDELLPQARQFLGGLAETASGRFGNGLSDTIGRLQDLTSIDRIEAALTGPSPGLEGQISALDAAIQDNLRNTTETIAGEAGLAGARGGARQAVATGLAGAEAARSFERGASSLLSQDFATRQALAPQLLAQRVNSLSTAGNLATGAESIAAGAASSGLAGLGSALQLGQAPFLAELQPLLAAAGIIQPITLSEQSSRGSGSSFSVGLPGS